MPSSTTVAGALLLLAISPAALGQERATTCDCPKTQGWRGGALGESLTMIPDLDGDGAREIVAGAPSAEPGGRHGAGQVLVLSGRLGKSVAAIDGTAPHERLGTSVAGCPDIDGDGVSEILASTDGWEKVGSGPVGRDCCVKASCTVRVYSGSGSRLLLTLTADGPRERFGYVLEGVPDLDGDGKGDVLVGVEYPTSAPSPLLLPPRNADTGLRGWQGEVRVFSGKGGPPIFFARPPAGRDWTVLSLARHHDSNGDGTPDFLVGAPRAREVYVCSGKDGAILRTIAHKDEALRFGKSVASVRDQDGDRVPDILVGAPAPFQKGPGPAGRVLLISGKDGTALNEILECDGGVKNATLFGEVVGMVGDTDGDGVQDILVCSPADGGAEDRLSGRAHVYSGRDRARRYSVTGRPHARLGQTGACPGDLNGDAVPDVVLGAPWSDYRGSSGRSAGEVVAVSGRDGQVLWEVVGKKWE